MKERRIIRVFPRRTSATPDDRDVRICAMPSLFDMELRGGIDEVHISVAFSWDLRWAEEAAEQWTRVAPVRIGGPALNQPGGEFVPGLYLKRGYVITSRGCPNRCWFCSVPKREGGVLRELPVRDGWIVADDNLLACSPEHIDRVFAMLARQPRRPQFTGGLEAARLTPEMAARLYGAKPEKLYFAYDTPNDLAPLEEAARMLFDVGFAWGDHKLRCYVLCGYKGDTFNKARRRMGETWRAGFLPFAMLYRDDKGECDREWKAFQREWLRPQIAYRMCVEQFGRPKRV